MTTTLSRQGRIRRGGGGGGGGVAAKVRVRVRFRFSFSFLAALKLVLFSVFFLLVKRLQLHLLGELIILVG